LNLESAGLIPALSQYASLLEGFPSYREACSRVHFLPFQERDTLPYAVRVAFFNVGREALLNAIRHARVEENLQGKIEVEFFKENISGEKFFVLRVEDNGLGFSYLEKVESPTNFGLADIRQQEKILQRLGSYAAVMITSTPGSGTQVRTIWKP
jgi:signal transduction histidine kinase